MYPLSRFKEIILQNKSLINENQSLKEQLERKEEKLKKESEKLETAREKVKEQSRLRVEFLSSLSHEVRTPMNAIIGMTDLLLKENPREDQFEHLEILDFSAKTLLALINDMLDFSRIESGITTFETVPFNLNNLLESVLDGFLFTANKNNTRLYVNLDDNIPEMIKGDPGRLTQILNNLVSNAIQLSEADSMGITAEKIENDTAPLNLLFTVGEVRTETLNKKKPADVVENLFYGMDNHFETFDDAGIRLSISKKLIELQGGHIYVRNDNRKGNTFFVEMTFDPEHDKNVDIPLNQPVAPASLEGAAVLVAEDNIINRKVLQRFLEKWKVRVLFAENGSEALAKLESNLVNLVLMDLQMPGIDGYEAARLIRSLDDTQKSAIPIIALTAAALKEVEEKVLLSGMDDYLTKPFDPDELQQKLKFYILNQK